MLHLKHSTGWCWNSATSKSRSKIPGKFLNMLQEKDGEISWTDCVRSQESRRWGIPSVQYKGGRLIGLVTSGIRTVI
jgi:hypothetical protein